MRTTKVFSKNITAYNQGHRIIANKGSSRSSKTYSVLQLLYVIAKYSRKSLVLSVVSRTLPHLKAGAMRDLDAILLEDGIIPDKIKNKTDFFYRIGESIVEFFGADQLDKVHGPARDILFLNEAYYIKFDVYTQLSLRTSGTIFIDYNPIQRYWFDDEVVVNEEPFIIHSTYNDNQFIPEGIKVQLDQKMERYERETANKTITNAFKNWCKVYLFGQDGILEGVIFEDWRYAETGELDMIFSQIPYGFGLDYGFFPDPDAMAKISIDKKRKKIYVKECIYTPNNGTKDLITQVGQNCKEDDLIIAESATPRTNKDLRDAGFNVKAVSKTKTVKEWVREMQDYEFIIGQDSINVARELQNYVWSDKKAGVPVDAYNHCFAGHTKIETLRGERPIREIVSGDYVLTSSGYQRVLKRFDNGCKEIFVYELKFDDLVIKLECTPDHKILTQDGWKQIQEIQQGEQIYLSNSLTEKNTGFTQMNGTFPGAAGGYTLWCGPLTMERFQKAMMFTTKTKTRRITGLRILNLLKVGYTKANMVKKGLQIIQSLQESFTQKVSRLHLNGTRARRGTNGIKTITKSMPTNCMKGLSANVLYADEYSAAIKNQSFVPINANQNNEEIQELIMKQDSARSAGMDSFAESILSNGFARTHALTKIDVLSSTESNVYDLMVENKHEYFANGVLVHNCVDAVRYYYMMTLAAPGGGIIGVTSV